MRLSYRLGGQSIGVTVQRESPGRFAITDAQGPRTVDASLLDAHTIQLSIEGEQHVVHVVRIGDARHVCVAGRVYVLQADTGVGSAAAQALAPPQIVAPMPGKVLQVLVEVGQTVAEGDGLVIVEAMKMEHRITAAAAATVKAVHVATGQMVDGGAVMLELEYAARD